MPRKQNNHVQQAPQQVQQAPQQVQQAPQVQQPSLTSTILQGFSFGAGQSLAYNIFRSDPKEKETEPKVTEPKVIEPKETKVKPRNLTECVKDEECNKLLETFLNKEFTKCMKENTFDNCKHFI